MTAPASHPERAPAFIGRAPRVYDAVIARQMGDSAAAWLQQLIYSIHKYGEFIDGQWWVRLSFLNLLSGLMHKDSPSTLKRALVKLKQTEIIKTCQDFNEHGYDRTTWYTVDEQRIYEMFWPQPADPPEPETEPPQQQVNLICEPEAERLPPEHRHQEVNVNPPSGHEVILTLCPEPETEPPCQEVNMDPGSKWSDLLRRLKKERIKYSSDSVCRTREAQIESAPSVQTEIDTDRDAPEPETSDFLIHLNLGKDIEPANDDPNDDGPMFVCGDMNAWLQPPDDDATPAAEPDQIAESCPHPGEDMRYFRPLPDPSFQCMRCGQTVWDEAAKPPQRRQPRRDRRIQTTSTGVPAMSLRCYRPFDPGPSPPSPEDYMAPCPSHGFIRATYDANDELNGCQICDWTPVFIDDRKRG